MTRNARPYETKIERFHLDQAAIVNSLPRFFAPDLMPPFLAIQTKQTTMATNEVCLPALPHPCWSAPGHLITSLLRHIRSIAQQRRTLSVLRHHLAALQRSLATRHTQAQDEQQCTDSKRKDPLQLEDRDLGEELADAGGCCR